MEPLQVIGNHCGYDDPLKYHMVCIEFYLAAKKGHIVSNREEGGWEIPGALTRHMSWRARFYAKQRSQGFVDNSGSPYLFTEICPYCGGELPPVVIVPRQFLPRGDATGDGE